MSKSEVSEFCRAFEFLDWGDGGLGPLHFSQLVILREYLDIPVESHL